MGFFSHLLGQPAPVTHKHRHRRHKDHDESIHHHSRRVEEDRMHSRPLYTHFDPQRLVDSFRMHNPETFEPIHHRSRGYPPEQSPRQREAGLRAPQHRARPARPVYRHHYEIEAIVEPRRRRRNVGDNLGERRHEPEIRHHSRRQESDEYPPHYKARRHVPVHSTLWEYEEDRDSRGKRRRHGRRRG